ncbi:MAG: GNAT family N-acetyltransferase [Pseudomonadota bacterium]
MKKVVLLKPDDMPQWDVFVGQHPYGSICHLSSWQDVLKKSFAHIEGHFFALLDDETSEILAGLPVYTVKSRLTGNRLVSAPFANLFDPLISKPEDMEILLAHIIELYKKTKSSYIEIRSLLSTPLIKTTRLKSSCMFKHHYLSLNETPDIVMKKFHRTCVRKNIKNAVKANLRINIAENKQQLYVFYKLYFRTRKDIGLPPLPYKFFEAVWDVFCSSAKVIFLIAELNQHPVAGLMVFKFKNRLSAEYLGWDRSFHALRPTTYIYWEAIKLAVAQGCDVFDFGRTAIHNNGLLAFKRRWGTEEVDMTDFFYPKEFMHKNSAGNEASWKYQLVKKSCEWSPDFLFQLIGNFCYRHMG